MLVLARTGDAYPDDHDASLRYRLPIGLTPTAAADGVPQAMVTRSQDGGLLHLRLSPVWPPFADSERPVSFAGGRFRLRLHSPSAVETGEWRTAIMAGDAVVDRSVSLSTKEVAIAKALGARSSDVVDVEVELEIRGLAPQAPWLLTAPWSTIGPRLEALLGSEPVPWARVEAAVLGLDEATFAWHPLEPGAIRLPRDVALRSVAAWLAPIAFTRGPDGWQLRDEVPARVDVRLDMPRFETERIGLQWSFTGFLTAQADPSRHLVDVTIPEPFTAAEISVFNDLPLDDGGIRRIELEIRTGGPTGRVRHTFLPGEATAVRLRFVRETTEDLRLEWTARATVVTSQGPAIHTVESRSGNLMVELDASTLGITALRVACHPALFAHVSAVDVTIGSRAIRLTRAAPVAWAVGRTPPASARVSLQLPSGDRIDLGERPMGEHGIDIGTEVLELGSIANVALRAADDAAARTAYVAIQVEGRGWRTLEPAATLSIPVRREHRFAAPRLRYRARVVPRDAAGRTEVMTETPWRDASSDSIVVAV